MRAATTSTSGDYFTTSSARVPRHRSEVALTVGTCPPAAIPRWCRRATSCPPSDFDRRVVGRFVDVAAKAGVDSFSLAGGVIVDDFDNDGQLEILNSNFDSCGQMKLFQRGPNGTFVDRATHAGLAEQLGGLNLLQTDYNNDGCKDVLVLRGGWELGRESLLALTLRRHVRRCHGGPRTARRRPARYCRVYATSKHGLTIVGVTKMPAQLFAIGVTGRSGPRPAPAFAARPSPRRSTRDIATSYPDL